MTTRLLQWRFNVPDGISGEEALRPRAILIPQSETEDILLVHFRDLGGDVEWDRELQRYRDD